MISEPIKILHTGDIQIEVRNHQQRYDEFEYLFQQLEKELQLHKPNIYLISGDVFENWNVNDTERKIFIDHIQNVLNYDFINEIVVQDGNHDINQRKDSNFIKVDGKDTLVKNSLETILAAINSPKIAYLDQSKYYPSRNIDGLVYFNWSQKTKHSNLRDEEYNPIHNFPTKHTQVMMSMQTCITLYHDPIRECINFDGKQLRGADDQPSMRTEFITNTVLAGDIHMPQIHEYGDDKKFIYCSSPIQRNFGEGDYYEDGKLYQNGVENHKINVCEIDSHGYIIKQEYVTIPQFNSFNTFKISNTIDKPTDINWEIINRGTNKSTVRVSYPSASEKYISWESEISELIKQANPDTNIVFSQSRYGKGLSTEDTEVTQTLSDVNQLLDIESVIEVSKEYINNIVNKTNSISPEDKQSAITYIENLFISELKNFNKNITQNNISLVSGSASNFMSFGDNVVIPLGNKGLTKLTGANGVGKTTLYNWVAWMITGLVYQSQNQNHKNANNLLVFNDYRWEVDEVNGSLKFINNGITYLLYRTINRAWKRNVTDEQKKSKDWRNYISGTNDTVELQDLTNDEVFSGNRATEMLDSMFKGINNLRRLVFINDTSLENLIKTDSATLAEEILNNIGFNYFDLMLQRYDELRMEKMATLSKPSITVDVMQQDLIEKENIKQSIATQSKNIEDVITEVNERIQKLENEKITELSKKHQITKNDIVVLEQQLETRTAEHTTNIEKLNTSLETNKKSIAELRTVSELESIIASRKELETITTNTINEKKTEQSLKKLEIDNEKKNLISLYSEIEKEKMSDIDKIRLLISDLKLDNANENTKITDLESEFQKYISTKVSEINTLISTTKDTINSIKISINDNSRDMSSKIDLINRIKQSPDTCDSCKQKLSQELLITRTNTINTLNNEVAELNKKITDIEKQLSKHNTELVEYNKKLSDIAEYKFSIYIDIQYEYDILGTRCGEIRDKIANNVIAIDNYNKRIETELPIIKESVKSDQRIINATQQINILIDKLDYYNKDLDKLISESNEYTTESKIYETELFNVQSLINEQERILSNIKLEEVRGEQLVLAKSEIELKYVHLATNERIDAEVNLIDAQLLKLNRIRMEHNDERNRINTQSATIDANIITLKQNIADAIEYRIADASFRQYKTLLGKKGLPLYIFTLIKPILNSKLNDLLGDMDFRLQFIEDNSLQMIDLSKPGTPARSPLTISGMQTVFCGLSLLYINRNLNLSFKMDELFIDEVSGKLNDGRDLEYTSMNYQQQLIKLLSKFTDMKVMIIDHVIDNMNEDIKLQVIPGNSGATITQINK